jgi:DNA-binding response OmpR family regulator
LRILIAEDDPVARRVLEDTVGGIGHEVSVACDGREAWDHLQGERFDAFVSDWEMPGIDGVELCRRLRARTGEPFCYVLLVTMRDRTEDVVEGILAGANDFMTKPYERAELEARLCAAERVVQLERTLAAKVRHLEQALEQVATLRRLLPICMYCKSIRNDQEAWDRIEDYLHKEGVANFTHAICPDCYEKEVRPMLSDMKERWNKKAG